VVTLICGYRHSYTNDVWIGADSRGVSGSFIVPSDMRKLLRAGRWRMGWAGNAAARLYLHNAVDELAACVEIEDLALTTRSVLKDAEFRDIAGERPGAPGAYDHGQECLVARDDGLWVIEPDGGVLEPHQPFVAIGRAQDVAYGAAAGLLHRGEVIEPAEFLRTVLEIGAQFYATVGPPYWVECVNEPVF